MTSVYLRDFLLIGMGVLGTTITPWGQFFISSFAFDKKIEKGKIIYSQMETYWGAFLTDFFSFFMIVATAATLFVHSIPLVSGEQAALAIQPFAGELAGTLFAIGILNAGFMGLVIVSLSTAYAFAEFFGLSGSLNDSYQKSKTFYILFIFQLIVATVVALFIPLSLFKVAVFTQTINAVALPPVFYYLIKLTNDRQLMGEFCQQQLPKNLFGYLYGGDRSCVFIHCRNCLLHLLITSLPCNWFVHVFQAIRDIITPGGEIVPGGKFAIFHPVLSFLEQSVHLAVAFQHPLQATGIHPDVNLGARSIAHQVHHHER